MNRHNYTGTIALTRLALKRDKLRMPCWIVAIGMMTALIVVAYAQFSSLEMKEMVTMASISQGMRMLVSPVASSKAGQLGSFFLFRSSFLLSIIVSMMNIQLVTRHTRHNEETGCAEMIGAAITGRYASLAAGMLTALITNLLLFAALLLAFILNGLPAAGSLAAAASFACLGLFFAGIAGITAQLSESSRGASGLASLVFGVTFLINSLGNVAGSVNDQALGFSSHRIAWLSPIGWVQQMYAFDKNRFPVILLFISISILLGLIAIGIRNKRDIGRGILPARRGPEKASPLLRTAVGLAWRLQRKTLLIWLIAMVLIGMIFGAVSHEFGQAVDNIDVFQQIMISADYFIYSMIAIVSIIVSLFTLQSLLRMHHEETTGHLEPFLSTPVSRFIWIISFISISLISTFILLLTFAASNGLAAGSSSAEIINLLKMALYQGCAVFVVSGLVVTVYGLFPHLSRLLAWLAAMIAIITGPLVGPMLDLPDRIRNLSPFTHISLLPGQTETTTIAALLIVGVVLYILGIVTFSRRNLNLQ